MGMATTVVTHEITVQVDHGTPVAIRGAHQERRVLHVLTTWRYRGRWWHHEITRDYFMIELHGGAIVDIFCENECWFATKHV